MYYCEGRSISEIHRETGYARETIRDCISQDDWNEKFKETTTGRSFEKLNKFKNEINSWLYEDKKAKKKQRHTAKRVFERLKEIHGEKFDCSYRTVAEYVAILKGEIFTKKSEGSLPLEHNPGEAQVDFGEAEYYERGKLFCGKYLNLSFPYSNKGYFQLYRGENQECLFEGLIAIFNHIGGIPTRIWFDNPSTMVAKILKDGERKLTEEFLRFMEHHKFEAVFCNPDSGNEKGNVEGKVGYHRRNMLVPIPRFDDLLVFNKSLLEKCELDAEREHYRKNSTIQELNQEDKKELIDLPVNGFDPCKYITVRTNGFGKFYLNSNLHEYSVAPKYANSKVLVKLSANNVIPLDESQREIVVHERFYGNTKQQSMKWIPYLTQLARSPRALKYTGIYQMLPEIIRTYLDRQSKGDTGKVLQTIAILTEKNGFESAVESVENALLYDVNDIDSLKNLHSRLFGKVITLPPMHFSNTVPELKTIITNLENYDAVIRKAGTKDVRS